MEFAYSQNITDLYGATPEQLEGAFGANGVVVDVVRARQLVESFGHLTAGLKEENGEELTVTPPAE